MESEFRSGRQQAAADGAAASAAAAQERGAGDWANYQPPSAVLQAVQQRHAAAPAPAPAAPAAAAAPQAQGGQRELPPALRARLAARGILPKDEGANGSAAAAGGSSAGEDAGPLPPGWHQATDPTYNHVYYYCPATGERSWTRPKPAVSGRGSDGRGFEGWERLSGQQRGGMLTGHLLLQALSQSCTPASVLSFCCWPQR